MSSLLPAFHGGSGHCFGARAPQARSQQTSWLVLHTAQLPAMLVLGFLYCYSTGEPNPVSEKNELHCHALHAALYKGSSFLIIVLPVPLEAQDTLPAASLAGE